MYVLLRFENQYNQHGGYFCGVFDDHEECESPNGHFGRKGDEETWYQTFDIRKGKHYTASSYVHNYEDSLKYRDSW